LAASFVFNAMSVHGPSRKSGDIRSGAAVGGQADLNRVLFKSPIFNEYAP